LTYLAQVEPATVEIENLAQGTAADQFFQFLHRGAVLEGVADHEHTPGLCGQRDQVGGFAAGEGERFFHQGVLAGEERLPGQGVMAGGRGGDDKGIEGRVIQEGG